MEIIKIYFLKLLKKFNCQQYFNFVVTKKINNVKVNIPIMGNVGLTNMVIKREWLDLIIEKFVPNSESATFVDVGVNIGQTLLRLKTIYPDVKYLGFEPNSTCTAYVQKLIKINNFQNSTILNVALSSSVDILVLEKDSDADARASFISNLRPNYFAEKENVLALAYQQFYIDEKISFIKIDVEGAEYEVLKGMSKAIEKYQPIITCEVLDSHSMEAFEFTQNRAIKLCQLLHSWNYNIIRLETNDAQIINFESMDLIKIVQWSPRSYMLNDYLFYPKSKKNEVINTLIKVIE